MYCELVQSAVPNPRTKRPTIRHATLGEAAWMTAATTVRKQPAKLTLRRPILSARERKGAPQKLPMVMRALMMPSVEPLFSKPK